MISALFLLLASPLLAFGLFLVWSRLSRRGPRWAWGAILVPPIALCLWIFWIGFSPSPIQFYRVFGAWPAEGITRIDSATDNWSDMGSVFLRFSAPAPEIDRLIAQGFSARTRLPDGLSVRRTPDWWQLQACPGETHYYAATQINGWPDLTLVYCRETGQALVEAHWLH